MGTLYRNDKPYGASIDNIHIPTKVSDLENDLKFQTISNVSSIVTPLSNSINDIEKLIPSQSSEINKLADKDFVNSSISTNTSNFIGTFNTLEELESQIATNNDYAFWKTTDVNGNVLFKRYKFVSDDNIWQFEYDLNNSSFTSEQWDSINSGITKELVNEIETVVGNTSVFIATTCNTESDIQKKEINIGDITLIAGALLGITFTNGNSFGDCLAEEPTYPTLSINGGTEYPICDSRGNTVGTGSWNDGDYIELRFTGTKFIIINSNVRQVVGDEYILLADGSKKSIDYYENGSYTLESRNMTSYGFVSSSGKVIFLVTTLGKKLPPNKKITLTSLYANLRSNVQRTSLSSGSLVYGGYLGTSADTSSITDGFNFYTPANDGRSIEPINGYLYRIRLARTSAWYVGHWNDVNNYTISGDIIKISFTISDKN